MRIQIKRSDETEAPGSLQSGELAVSFLDEPMLFIGSSSGVLPVGGTRMAISQFAPADKDFSIAGFKFEDIGDPVDLGDAMTRGYMSGNFLSATSGGIVPGNITIQGNLIVEGTTTRIDSTVVRIVDNIVTIASETAGTPALNAGITVNRGEEDDASFLWDESDDSWSAGGYRFRVGDGTSPGDAVSLGQADAKYVPSSGLAEAGSLLLGNGAGQLQSLSGNTANEKRFLNQASGVASWLKLAPEDLPRVPVNKGGTNLIGAVKGDLVYASAPDVINLLPTAASGRTLVVAGGMPTWGTFVAGADEYRGVYTQFPLADAGLELSLESDLESVASETLELESLDISS